MTTALDICNNALGYLGLTPLDSLEDETQNARTCNRFYSQTRDSYLLSHDWSFALKVNTELSADSELDQGDLIPFAYAYEYPADCLKTMSVHGENDNHLHFFEIRSIGVVAEPYFKKLIFTNLESAYSDYIARIEDPDLFDPYFKEALEKKIAFEISWPLYKDSKIQKQMFDLFSLADAQAKRTDFSEQVVDHPEYWVNSHVVSRRYPQGWKL